jgi:hypothetical protein
MDRGIFDNKNYNEVIIYFSFSLINVRISNT